METLTPSSLLHDLPELSLMQDLGASLSGSFMNLSYKGGSRAHYSQFGEDVCERYFIGSDKKVQAKFTAFTKTLYQKGRGPVKVLFITDVRTLNSREALIGWSEKLLPEVLNLKKGLGCDHALFFLSRRERGLFDFFIRPRKKRDDQIRFSHLRGVGIEMVQGQTLFAEKPLEHINIRLAEESDIEQFGGYIKQASKYMPLSRDIERESWVKDFNGSGGFSHKDLALAFNASGEIVGSLGAFNILQQADISMKFSDVLEPTFGALQSYLRFASWFSDLRPVLREKNQPLKFFTHMYFNNHDIFYSLMCWWINQTKVYPRKDRPVFLYPFYKGDLKASAPDSLFVSGFKGDLYLIQDSNELPSELLKPVLFSEALDIDLPFLI